MVTMLAGLLKFAPDVRDVLCIAGFLGLIYGLSLVFVPAAFIVGGAILLYLTLFHGRVAAAERQT
jgi:hypothetical protein